MMVGSRRVILLILWNSGVNCTCNCQVWLPYHVRDKETEETDSWRDQRKRFVWLWNWLEIVMKHYLSDYLRKCLQRVSLFILSQASRYTAFLMLTATRMRNTSYRCKLWTCPGFHSASKPLVQVAQLRESIPFAVCGANAMVEVAGKKVRGRQYPIYFIPKSIRKTDANPTGNILGA